MHIYKIKFESEDFNNSYLLDVEVLGRNQEQAIELAYAEAKKFCDGSNRINTVEDLGSKMFFGKPKILKVTNGLSMSRNSVMKERMV